MRRLVLAVVTICAMHTGTAAAQPPAVTIPRVSDPPVIDRYLDGQSIPPGAHITGLVQREPGDGTPTSMPTDVYVSYDTRNLYVVFICKQDRSKVRAHLTKREAIIGDDIVGIMIDTFHDQRRAYSFITNPLGVQMDGISTEGRHDDWSFDTIWHSSGRLTPDGFVVLMAIPFKSLRFTSAPAQRWGFAVVTLVPANNETSFWPHITRKVAGFAQQFATLEGLEGISPGRNLQAIPYGTFAAARFRNDDGIQETDRAGRAGIDGKMVLRDSVTVDVTANPDFSQVESDEPQVTVNQRFEVFFPEKRPFFIENAGFFDTPQRLFFSRRVADPGVGARITGKAGSWTIAGLGINDRQPGHAVMVDDPLWNKRAGIGVARLQREFGDQSNIGIMMTDRQFGSRSNLVVGADARVKLTANWFATGQVAHSHTVSADGEDLNGALVYAGLSRESRHFTYNGRYIDRGPGFRSLVGYIPRVDIRQTGHDVGYTWRPEKSRLLSFGPELKSEVIWNHAGDVEDWSLAPSFDLEFPGQTELGFEISRAFERFEDIEFRRHRFRARASTEWLRWLRLNGRYTRGTEINYYPGPGMRPFLANGESIEAGLTVKPSPRLRLDQSYLFTRLSTRAPVVTPAGTASGSIFTNHILRTRATYQFTRELSLRAIVDYERVSPNHSLVDLKHEEGLRADVLLTYLVNPWTALYVGYTDAYDNATPGIGPDGPWSRRDTPASPVARQLFVKVSYLFRY